MRFRETFRTALRAFGLLVGLFVAGPAQAVTLTRGPYLQLLTTHSVTIVTVSERLPGLPLGAFPSLQVSDKSGKRLRSFFRVAVSGVGTRTVTAAQLRLQASGVTGGGQTGGRISQITSCAWDERRVTWSTQPAIDGPPLVTSGAMSRGNVMRFEIGRAITGDGVYCFALDTTTPDVVTYTAREGLGRAPDVVIDLGPPSAPPPLARNP